MSSRLRRTLISCLALMLAVAAIGGAVTLGQSNHAPERVQDAAQSVDPVREGEAGAVVVGAVIGAYAVGMAACDAGYTCDSPSAEEMAKADALETKKSLHQQALTQRQNNDNWHQQVSNELQDTKSIARMEGKNEYIRELNNGTVEAVARAEAREAVADYYAVRQKMMIQQWKTTLVRGDSMAFTAQNTSEMGENFVKGTTTSDNGQEDNYNVGSVTYLATNQTISLTNGTTETVPAMQFDYSWSSTDSNGYTTNGDGTITSGIASNPSSDGLTIETVYTSPPNDNYDSVTYVDFSEWVTRWNTVQQYNDDVQNEIDDYVNSTYDQYQQGEIDSSDLVDPYLGAREYDPQNSSSWALRSAMSMGINPPEETGSIDTMTVTTDNETVSGLLMMPGDQTVETGAVYNASNQTGQQYVLNPETGEMQELTGEYTVSKITKPDGSTRAAVEYTDTEYGATDITEYQQKMERLNNLTAQVNARQQRLRQAASGGSSAASWLNNFLDGIGLGGIPAGAVIVLAVLTLLAIRLVIG